MKPTNNDITIGQGNQSAEARINENLRNNLGAQRPLNYNEISEETMNRVPSKDEVSLEGGFY